MRIWRFDSHGWLVTVGEAPEGLYPADATDAQPPEPEGGLIPRWMGANWTLQAKPLPTPVMKTALQAIGPDAGKALVEGTEATVLFGAGNKVRATVRVEVLGHLLDGTDGFPSFDAKFRMPVQSVDAFDKPSGPAIQKLFVFSKGVGVIDFEPEAAVCYLITQEAISSRLKPDEMVKLESAIRIVAVK